MSTTNDLVSALKSELKTAGITYAMLAERLEMAESSIKRMFSVNGDLPLSRIDALCRVLGMDLRIWRARWPIASPCCNA